MKIVSGGQTGADRAALDAALELGVEAGGWCPEGRMAEDGPIPEHYPVRILPNAGYADRTERNVLDSDGTAVFYFSRLSGGTKLTVTCCEKLSRPHVLIDGSVDACEAAASKLTAFVRQYAVNTLNVAGPRASGEPGAYSYTKAVMLECLQCAITAGRGMTSIEENQHT